MKDLVNEISIAQSLVPRAITTVSISGATVDLRGYESATFVIDAGDWTDGTHTIVLQESDTDVDGDFTAIADADLIGTEPAIIDEATDDQVYEIGYRGVMRYVRIRSVVTDAPGTGAYYTGSVIRHAARHNPAGVAQV